jgi:HD-like signal output (HDOD) protein
VDAEQTRAEVLEAWVERLSASGDLPAFAEQVRELMSASTAQNASLGHLTDAILKNVSLTAKVLKTVNSAFFNRTGETILSVSRAVALLGWNTVRDLAAGILLFEHFKSQAGARELMLLSLLTANHAREVAGYARYPREEEAYLCGMFRGLGEVLVACYMPREYADIVARMQEDGWTPREASLRVLSFSYDDLARAMVRRWRLGERVSACMGRPELLNPTPSGESELLALIVAFSHELSTAVYRVGGDDGRDRMRLMLKRWGPGLGVPDGAVEEILTSALAETRDTFAAAHVPLDGLRLGRQMASALRATPEETPASIFAEPAEGGDASSPAWAPPGAETLARLTDEVASVMRSGESFGLDDVIMMILEAIYRGTGCDRVLFCLVDTDRSHLRARMGVGEGAADLVARFRFPASLLSGPVGPAVLMKRDVFVDDVSASRYGASSFAAVVRAGSFALCPLAVHGVVIGCLYFDRKEPGLGLTERTRQSILALREWGNQAIARMSRR